jgi:Amt family ammonium transporter
MSLNGILAGLVGITAGADTVTILGAVTIGLVAGLLVVGSVLFFDRIKIDDPVGAISVHLVCGIWGTLAVGIFSTNPAHTFGVQLVGVAAYAAFTATAAFLLFAGIRAVMGLRVGPEEELEGLDLAEHGSHAYDYGKGTRGIEDEPGSGLVRPQPSLAPSES